MVEQPDQIEMVKQLEMVKQPDLDVGNSEIAIVLLSFIIIMSFTGKNIWKHFTSHQQ